MNDLTTYVPEEENIGAVKNRIIICIGSEDLIVEQDTLSINFDSSENEILEAIRPVVKEKYGDDTDIWDESNGWLYKVRKSIDSQNIHILPNSTAGNK